MSLVGLPVINGRGGDVDRWSLLGHHAPEGEPGQAAGMVWCLLESFVALRALWNPSITCCPPSTINQSLQIQNEADACLRVALAAGANAGYQFKTHPNIDKAAYGCVLSLRRDGRSTCRVPGGWVGTGSLPACDNLSQPPSSLPAATLSLQPPCLCSNEGVLALKGPDPSCHCHPRPCPHRNPAPCTLLTCAATRACWR